MFFVSNEFGAVKKPAKKKPVKKAAKKKPVKKTTAKKAPALTVAGAGAGLVMGAPRLVVLEATADFNQLLGNAYDTQDELRAIFSNAGWDIKSVSVVKDSLFLNDVRIKLQASIPSNIDAETIRQDATELIQGFRRWWITGNYPVFLNVDCKIVSDYRTTTTAAPVKPPTKSPSILPTIISPAAALLPADSITTASEDGGGFLGNLGYGLGFGGGLSTPVVVAALVVLGLIILKK